jgi:hypothetical protein
MSHRKSKYRLALRLYPVYIGSHVELSRRMMDFHRSRKFRRGMDGELLEKTKSIFGGVFPIWPRPARSWNSSADKLRNPFSEDADHP